MSAPFNYGCIDLNKPITQEVADIIEEVLYLKPDRDFNIGETEITIDDYQGWQLNSDIDELIDRIASFGYILNGVISYYGDDCDGRYDIINNVTEDIPKEEFALHDASDEELISILEDRGYTVIKYQ